MRGGREKEQKVKGECYEEIKEDKVRRSEEKKRNEDLQKKELHMKSREKRIKRKK